MTITYKGKVYEEVADGSAEIGDLLHVTVLDGNASDVWCFSTDNLAKAPDVDIKTPNGGSFLDDDLDVWTRYRKTAATKTAENKPTPPKPYETGRYKVASIDSDAKLYVNSAGEDFVMLRKDTTLAAYFTDVSIANKLAETANTYGIGTFSVYKEVASLVRLEAADID